jgi:hypothetical protein
VAVRDISAHLVDLYGIEIGRDMTSTVTDALLEDVEAWRTRPLDEAYPIAYFDALRVKVRGDRSVRNPEAVCEVGRGPSARGALTGSRSRSSPRFVPEAERRGLRCEKVAWTRASRASTSALAKEFGMSDTLIREVRRGELWVEAAAPCNRSDVPRRVIVETLVLAGRALVSSAGFRERTWIWPLDASASRAR